MVDYKYKYLKYKIKYLNTKGGSQQSSPQIAEVDSDNEVDNEQIPQPELEYGLVLQDNIDESLKAIHQTTNFQDSVPFPYLLENINYYVLVMHGIIGTDNILLNKNTSKSYDYNHTLLNRYDTINLKIINKHLSQYPNSIFLQFATTSGNTCTMSDKDITIEFLLQVKQIYKQFIETNNNIFDFFRTFPRYPGFILQALLQYDPNIKEQNVFLEREDHDKNFSQQHNLYQINSMLEHPDYVETYLNKNNKGQKWEKFYLNQIIAQIITELEKEGTDAITKPIVITMFVCRGFTTVPNYTNPAVTHNTAMTPRNNTVTEQADSIPIAFMESDSGNNQAESDELKLTTSQSSDSITITK